MTESSTINKGISDIKKLITEEIAMGGDVVIGISSDYTEKHNQKLVTSKALFDAYTLFFRQLSQIQEVVTLFEDKSTITTNLLSATMESVATNETTGYVITGYDRSGTQLYTNRTVSNFDNNCIKIPNTVINKTGRYIDIIEVESISGGFLQFTDNNGEVLGTVNTVGTSVISVEIADTNSFYINIKFISTEINCSVTISTNGLYFVTNRLYQYLVYMFSQMLTDFSSSGYVTQNDLSQVLVTFQTTLIGIITDSCDGIYDALAEHIGATNPHGITPGGIGAAQALHTHTPESIGAADRNHTHSPISIGAADRTHTHTPASIGAATATHTHDDRYLLKTDIIVPKVYKPSIVLDAPVGMLPNPFLHTSVNLPIVSIKGQYLTHNTLSYFDPHSGIITSSRLSINDLYKAVLDGDMTVFDEETTGTFLPTMINYKFHMERAISTIYLRKDEEGAFAYPTQIAVYANDILTGIYNTVWVDNTATITLTSPISSVFKIGIQVTTISAQAQWVFGMNVKFSDTNDCMFAVAAGISCTFEELEVATVSPTLSEDLPFDISNMVANHPYFIALAPSESASTGLTTHVADLPPEYGVIDKGTRPFLSNYIDGPSNEFYGNIAASSEDPNYPIERVYNINNDSYKSEAGTDNVTINHVFPVAREIKTIDLYFLKTELSNLPTNIRLRVTLSGGTMLDIANITGYIPDTNNGDDTYVTLSFNINQTITAFQFVVSGTVSSQVAISLIRVSLVSEFYNINKQIWSDNGLRNYIGVIYKRSDTQFEIRPYYTGVTACIGINGLSKTVANALYEIVNPFGSRSIDVELFSMGNNVDPIAPLASITNITNDKIVVESITSDIFAIRVTRDW